MESSKKPESRQLHGRRFGRRFTPAALSRVLSEALQLTPDDPLYVAYSGGMDSHVLLHAAAALRRRAPWRVAALHIDHGLQPASSGWSRHCGAVCSALNVPYQTERVEVREIAQRGLEDAARRARYDALQRLLPPGGVLLVAHHQRDQAETLMLQLLRGAGVPGLAAMPEIAPFGRGRLARPLLGFSKSALDGYAGRENLQWVEDASNLDTGPGRNYLRQRVWPALAERWPQASECIARAARHQAEAAALLDELGQLDLGASKDGAGGLQVAALQALSLPRRANALRYWMRAQGVAMPAEAVLRHILAGVADTPQTQHAAVSWPGAEVRRYRDRLVLRVSEAPTPGAWEAAWQPSSALNIPGTTWQLQATPAVGAGLSCARISGRTLHVRSRRGGERFLLRGHHRKLKKLLQEAGIPPWERGHWPLVYVGDDLAAVGDRWISDPYAARANEAGLVLMLERERVR